ncbi:exported hypothetical protein [Gammaproteobacteria bacterium]
MQLKERIKQLATAHATTMSLAMACFLSSGTTLANDQGVLGIGLGVLGVAFLSINDSLSRREKESMTREAYAMGLSHAQRRTGSR